jgi:dihydroflavonol-4-reductase
MRGHFRKSYKYLSILYYIMEKILITGGCGFLGYYLIKDIKKHFPKATIKILDLRENPIENYRINDKSIKISLGKDITKLNSIKNEFKGFDTVIHCAGLVSFSLKDKENLFKVNVDGTKNVLKSAFENGVKNFVHVSSVAALGYKDCKNDFVDEDFKFDWKVAEKKHKYYMLTKYLADVEVKKYYEKMNTLILYPGLMLGPGDLKNSAKLIQAIKEKRIPFNMPGGTNIADVRDVSKGIVLAMKKKSTGDFLLSGHNLSFSDSNRIIAEVVGEKPPSKTMPKFLNPFLYFILLNVEKIKPNIELTADNIDSSFKYRYFDNSKATKEFSWKPEIEFRKTIKDIYNWMVKDGISK